MSQAPVVGILMGSDSDWPIMSAAADVLVRGAVRTTGATATITITALQDIDIGADGDLTGVGGARGQRVVGGGDPDEDVVDAEYTEVK